MGQKNSKSMSVQNAGTNFSDRPLYLSGASYKATKYACLNWHYAKRTPVGRLVSIGVWEFGKFIGVVLFGFGAAGVGRLYKRLGIKPTELCELQRVALTTHKHEVTKIVAIAIRLLKEKNPGLALVLSYADPGQGHKGTIYHAGNWVPWGMSAATWEHHFLGGVVRHDRATTKSGFVNHFGKIHKARRRGEAVEKRLSPAKYRFLYPLNDTGRKAIERVKQAMVESHSKQRRGSTDPHAPMKKGRAVKPSLLKITSHTI